MKKEKKPITREERKKMKEEDKWLFVVSIQKTSERIGELKEFKIHVIGRVEKLEKKEEERGKERISVFSILISAAALAISIIVNFFKQGGK
jgi:peptide subunit release factor 1 (eRF1)